MSRDEREWELVRKENRETMDMTLSGVVGPPISLDDVLVPRTALEAVEAERDGYCAGHRIEQELRKGVEEHTERVEAELADARAQHLVLSNQTLDATTRAEQAEAERDALAKALRKISLMGILPDEDRPQKQWQVVARSALAQLEPKP